MFFYNDFFLKTTASTVLLHQISFAAVLYNQCSSDVRFDLTLISCRDQIQSLEKEIQNKEVLSLSGCLSKNLTNFLKIPLGEKLRNEPVHMIIHDSKFKAMEITQHYKQQQRKVLICSSVHFNVHPLEFIRKIQLG